MSALKLKEMQWVTYCHQIHLLKHGINRQQVRNQTRKPKTMIEDTQDIWETETMDNKVIKQSNQTNQQRQLKTMDHMK